MSHLESQSLLASVQSAYRADHSTETALLRVLNDILLSIDCGNASILALIDQSAAFDTVDQTILLNRLSSRFGIRGTALTLLTTYLRGRRQSVSMSGCSSSPVLLTCGVPQGSVLGPILYILHNTPMHDIAESFGIADHYFADDAQLYTNFRPNPSSNNQSIALSRLSTALAEQGKWLANNHLKLK